LKYVRVVSCVAEDDSIRVEMLGEDQENHRFEVGSECAGVLASQLAAEFEKLKSADKEQQFVRPIGLQTAKTEAGEPMLLLTLEGGAELPLVFRPESVGLIISELQGLMGAVQVGPDIRWR
jgi:hypothetical protein